MNPNANLNNIFDFPDLPLVLPKIEVPDSSDFLLPSPQELQQFDPPRNLVSQIARRWSCGDSQHAVDEMPASYYHNLGFALHNHIQMSNQRYLSDFNCPSTVSPIPSAHEPGQMPPMTPYDHIGQDPHLFSAHAYGNSMMPSDGSYFDNGSRSISAPNIGNPGLNTTVMTSGNSQSCANRRRFRTNFTEQQSSFLEDSFKESHYPDHKSKKHMANYLNIPEDRITVWFQNRRAKWRRKEHRQRDRSKNELFTSTPSSFDYSCFPGPNPEEIPDVKHPNIYGMPGSQLQMTHDPFQMNPDGNNVEYLHNQGQH